MQPAISRLSILLLLLAIFSYSANATPTSPKPTTKPKTYTLTCGSNSSTTACRAFPLYFSCNTLGKLKFNRLPEEIDECLSICKCI
ncbi:hypothetical protein DL95DRAFT_457116 [Leptodontidium sp. 2 PMI_412]|nr:hypothetical protein BKA61DRAFT_676037 [Leptodontidium sp. MPI-SDFR-AT-0119]KAH9219854.1 hypothetical protein DL95DRAFT_457116 [Leptodontidium sp. 2 PMI_412]